MAMRTPFTGCGTALVTPFTAAGALDEAGVRRVLAQLTTYHLGGLTRLAQGGWT